MDKNRDHLTVMYGKSAQEDIPVEAKDYYVEQVSSGTSPSTALRQIISKYALERLDHTVTFALLRAAYPPIELMDEGLSSRIIDADYPNFTDGLTDQEFDEIVARIKEGSDAW